MACFNNSPAFDSIAAAKHRFPIALNISSPLCPSNQSRPNNRRHYSRKQPKPVFIPNVPLHALTEQLGVIQPQKPFLIRTPVLWLESTADEESDIQESVSKSNGLPICSV